MLPIIDTVPPPPPNQPADRYTVHVLVDVDPRTAPPVPREELGEAVRRRLVGESQSTFREGEGDPEPGRESTPPPVETPTATQEATSGADDASVTSPDNTSDAPTVRVDDPRKPPVEVNDAAAQTWDWPHVTSILPRCRTAYTIHHDDASLDRQVRLLAIRSTVAALLDVLESRGVQVVAIFWEPSQRLVHPAAFRESLAHGGPVGDYGLNVRLFAIPDGGPDERLMDTRGLAEFGLPDLQCRFAGLPPAAIAAHLMSYAEYLFDKGDVIADGDVVRGLSPDEEWECVRGHSLSLPAREVLDVRPEGHAAAHPD